jgi:acetamidase/formamidase
MDFPQICPGNTLYLPVFHEGGLLVFGDVHAFQGDGELYAEGGECAADVTVALDVDRTYRHPRPLVQTPTALIGLACGGSLYEGIRLVTEDMTALVARLRGVSQADAYVYCALVGSLGLAACLAHRSGAERNLLVTLSVPKA